MRLSLHATLYARGGGGGGGGGGESALVAQLQGRISELTTSLTERTRECETLRLSADGGGRLYEMRAKLDAAEADVARLVREREKLMEISNMLRADLNRLVADGGGGDGGERAQREVAARYESKLSEIELAMQARSRRRDCVRDRI